MSQPDNQCDHLQQVRSCPIQIDDSIYCGKLVLNVSRGFGSRGPRGSEMGLGGLGLKYLVGLNTLGLSNDAESVAAPFAWPSARSRRQ